MTRARSTRSLTAAPDSLWCESPGPQVHHDAYDCKTEHGQNNCKRGGQRLVTTMVYLSDVEAGGTTAFPKLGVEVVPKLGRVAVFYNCDPGETEGYIPNTLHCGSPVIKGVKWAANKWVRKHLPMQVRHGSLSICFVGATIPDAS